MAHIFLETLVLRYEFQGKARTRPDIFRVVLGPCASEQKWGQTPKSKPKQIDLRVCLITVMSWGREKIKKLQLSPPHNKHGREALLITAHK